MTVSTGAMDFVFINNTNSPTNMSILLQTPTACLNND